MNWCLWSNKAKAINLSRLSLPSLSYRSSYYVFNWYILVLKKAYVKFHLRNYYDHSFHEHTSLGSPKGTHCLNFKIYHGVSIENTYCYQLPSTVTQFIGNIWSTYDLTRRLKPLLTLAQAQYYLKVEKQHNEAYWWGHDYLIALSHDSL